MSPPSMPIYILKVYGRDMGLESKILCIVLCVAFNITYITHVTWLDTFLFN
jgi:hypothetical protein